jgi:hypothetical protein
MEIAVLKAVSRAGSALRKILQHFGGIYPFAVMGSLIAEKSSENSGSRRRDASGEGFRLFDFSAWTCRDPFALSVVNVDEQPSATIQFDGRFFGLSAAVLHSYLNVAVLMHRASIFIDLAVFERHTSTTYPTTKNSTEQGTINGLPL